MSQHKLESLVTYDFRKQEINIQFVLIRIIIKYLHCIDRIIEKRTQSKRFEITPIKLSQWKSEKSNDIEFEFKRINFKNKITIGICKPISNPKKRLENDYSFGGLFIKKHKIFMKDNGIIEYEIGRIIKLTDIITIKYNITSSDWTLCIQESKQEEAILFRLYGFPQELFQLSICLFDDTDSVCISHIHNNNNNLADSRSALQRRIPIRIPISSRIKSINQKK